jgi:benzoate/toluate 1,2-dioxygenase alpha subunit/p-cumate 2,3-dioxygenase alpha subunit
MNNEVPVTTVVRPAREFWRQWDRLMHGDDGHVEVAGRPELQGAGPR